MSIMVKKPGLLTSVQDAGRHGHHKDGVVVSGAMDRVAQRMANLLVGNEEGEGALEITLLGPTLQFADDALVALAGGDFSARIGDQSVPMRRPVFVRAGSVLTLAAAKKGCRAYLAVAGGFDLPLVMGSKSTYLRGGFGGFAGRALQAGDVLQVQEPSIFAKQAMRELAEKAAGQPFACTDWFASDDLLPAYADEPVIRVVRGREFEQFSQESIAHFFGQTFQVTPQSDRMGYRLAGPALALSSPLEMISEAVAAGTVQVPPEGQPIVLMADCQTTGGYPKIAQVASADLPLLAQMKPGQSVRFQEVSLAEAQALFYGQEQKMMQFRQGLSLLGRQEEWSHAPRGFEL